MAGSIHDVLFRLLGDDDDARQSLEEITAELEAFSRIHAQADATLDTGDAEQRLRELRINLERLDATTSEPKIKTDIAGVLAQIQVLQAELRKLDGENVEIDVDVQRGIAERIGEIGRQTSLLGRASKVAEAEAQGFWSRIANSAVHVGAFTTQLKTAIPLVIALSGVIVSLVGGLAALASSLGAAIAGAGALGIAFGGVLIPAIGLVIAAFQRFKAQADEPGTAAHALSQAFELVSKSLQGLEKVADPILRALATLMRPLAGFISAIAPAFMDFGRAAADAIKPIRSLLSDNAFISAFADMIEGAGDALRPLVAIGVQLFRIFTNIADAAMPLLVAGLKDVAQWLRGIGSSTENITALRAGIGVLVDNLRLWLDLIGQISRVFINFARAALPAGQELVGWLRDGASAIADWLGSSEGIDRVRQFFDDTLPLAKAVVDFIAKLVLAFIQLGEVISPVLTPIVEGFNAGLDVINFLLDKLNQIPAPIKTILGIAATLFLPFTKLKVVLAALEIAFSGVKQIAVAVFDAIKIAAEAVWDALKTAVAAVAGAFSDTWNAMKGAARDAWDAIKSTISDVLDRIKAIVQGALDAVKSVVSGAWDRVKSLTSGVWDAIKSIIVGAWDRIKSVVRDATDAVKNVLSAAWDRIKSVASEAWDRIKGLIVDPIVAALGRLRDLGASIIDLLAGIWERVKSAASDAWGRLKDFVTGAFGSIIDFLAGLPGKFFDLATEIFQKFLDGAKAIIGKITGAVTDIFDFVTNKLSIMNKGIVDTLGQVQNLANEIRNMPSPPSGGGRGKVGVDTGNPLDKLAELFAPVVSTPAPAPRAAVADVLRRQRDGDAATRDKSEAGAFIENLNVSTPAGTAPDATHLLAQLDEAARRLGGWGR